MFTKVCASLVGTVDSVKLTVEPLPTNVSTVIPAAAPSPAATLPGFHVLVAVSYTNACPAVGTSVKSTSVRSLSVVTPTPDSP